MQSKPYTKFKPSGVEWLGDVPEHWEVKRLKNTANYWVSNVDKVPNESELPVRLCNYTDVYYNDFISSEMNLMETTATHDEIKKFHLIAGDVVITKDSEEWNDIAISSLVIKTAPNLVCGYHLAMIRPKKEMIVGQYLLRQFQSSAINHQFQIAATGVTRYGLPKNAIGEAIIPLPPLSEQHAIAAFLDHETGHIDALIAKKKKLLSLLAEQRTALISRAVTKGLNPSVKLKPSGVEWLGDMPEHWENTRLRRIISLLRNGTPSTQFDEESGMLPVTRIETISKGIIDFEKIGYVENFDRSHDYLLSKGDILLSHINSLSMIGNAALYDDNRALYSGMNLLRISPSKNTNSKWLWYFIRNDGFKKTLSSRAKPAINQASLTTNQIREMPIILPPLPEQQAIAAFLDRETAKIDTLSAKVLTAIERLKEYRTALISAAVTGKIDVREAV